MMKWNYLWYDELQNLDREKGYRLIIYPLPQVKKKYRLHGRNDLSLSSHFSCIREGYWFAHAYLRRRIKYQVKSREKEAGIFLKSRLSILQNLRAEMKRSGDNLEPCVWLASFGKIEKEKKGLNFIGNLNQILMSLHGIYCTGFLLDF